MKIKQSMTIYYSSLKAETITNESHIDNVFKSIYTAVIKNIQNFSLKDSRWIIDSVIYRTNSISKYNTLAGRSYIRLPKELDDPGKCLINIQNTDDNEWFKWCLVKYLNPADHLPARITKHYKDFAKALDFKDVKFPVNIRDIHKIEKNNSISISVFGYENKEKHPIYVSKTFCEDKHVDMLLIGEGEKIAVCYYQRFQYSHV